MTLDFGRELCGNLALAQKTRMVGNKRYWRLCLRHSS